MGFCLHCGQRLPDQAVHCPACGAPIEGRETTAIMADVEDLIRAGRKIEAIKAYREATGASLKDAKDAVEAWERDAGGPARLQHGPLNTDAKELARAGRKIEAIKAYREASGASLKEAKDAVEAWMRDEGITSAAGLGCATSVLLLSVVIVTGWLCWR